MCAMMPQLRTTLEMPRLGTTARELPEPRRQAARPDARTSIGRAGRDARVDARCVPPSPHLVAQKKKKKKKKKKKRRRR
jgi:hypothetical protein